VTGGKCSCGKAGCDSPAKHPRTANGFLDATKDQATIDRLFRGDRAGSNIGLATGPASGIWILDEDGPAGMQVVEALERQHGKLPITVSALTGRSDGGRHRYFTYPAIEIKSRNKIELPGYGKVNVDIRGTGGYAILPPSIHASGQAYRWEHSPDSTAIAAAPDWLIDLVCSQSSHTSQEPLIFTVGSGPVEDLATAPGESEGKRHGTALRLIGSAIGRGLDPCVIAQQAVDWARRCKPPMSDEDVLQIVSDLCRKQTVKVEAAIQAEVEDMALPKPVEWPVLDQDAMHGIAGEIVHTIEPQSEADPVAILTQFLVSVGNMIGRKPYYRVEGTSHHCNLFAVLVGSTARGRKGTSEGRVREILHLTEEAWVLDNIKTGLVSGEGLVWAVRDPIYKVEHQREKGRIVGTEMVLADPGVSDKRLLVVEPEFAAVLRVCKRETNTLSPTIRSAWDTGILRTLAKNSPAKATDAHISIAGHITIEELRRGLAEVDGFNGFANRFLWVAVKRSKLLPDGGKDLDLAQYAARLQQVVELAKVIERMRRDKAATDLWRSVGHIACHRCRVPRVTERFLRIGCRTPIGNVFLGFDYAGRWLMWRWRLCDQIGGIRMMLLEMSVSGRLLKLASRPLDVERHGVK
jgi:hypothetical protein